MEPPFLRLVTRCAGVRVWHLLDEDGGRALRAAHPQCAAVAATLSWHWLSLVDVHDTARAMRRFCAAWPRAACGVSVLLSRAGSGAGAEAWCRALPPRVTRVVLDGGSDGVVRAAIAALPPRVRQLAVTNCLQLTAAVSFRHLPALEQVDCSFVTVADAVLASLPPSVTELNLRNCRGVTPAVTFAHLPALTVLNCGLTRVGDGTLASLPPSVRELTLNNTAVTDAAALRLHGGRKPRACDPAAQRARAGGEILQPSNGRRLVRPLASAYETNV